MRKTSNFFKSSAILSTTIFTLLGACAIEDPIDYTTGSGSYDFTSPTAVSLEIDNGTASTSSFVVTLDMIAKDDVAVTSYYASESRTKPSATANGWKSFQQTTKFTLSETSRMGIYPRNVYVWFKDNSGNISESVEGSINLIVYDTTAPSANAFLIDNGSDSTNDDIVNLIFNATDDEEVTDYYVSESSSKPLAGDAGWTSYKKSVSYTFDNDTSGEKNGICLV